MISFLAEKGSRKWPLNTQTQKTARQGAQGGKMEIKTNWPTVLVVVVGGALIVTLSSYFSSDENEKRGGVVDEAIASAAVPIEADEPTTNDGVREPDGSVATAPPSENRAAPSVAEDDLGDETEGKRPKAPNIAPTAPPAKVAPPPPVPHLPPKQAATPAIAEPDGRPAPYPVKMFCDAACQRTKRLLLGEEREYGPGAIGRYRGP